MGRQPLIAQALPEVPAGFLTAAIAVVIAIAVVFAVDLPEVAQAVARRLAEAGNYS